MATEEQQEAKIKWEGQQTLTVGELVAELEELDPTALVLVDGYEGGFEAPATRIVRVTFDGGSSYCGPWSRDGKGRGAVVVGRRENYDGQYTL